MSSKTCSVNSCSKKVIALGVCSKHYTRLKRYGDVDFPGLKGGGRPTKIDFKVNKRGCFIITSHKLDEDGYSEIQIRGKTKKIHRHVYEQCFGKIPKGLVIRHKCDEPSCINPEHLETGTHQDNVADMLERDRHAKGSRKSNSILKESDIPIIREMIDQGHTNRFISRKYSIDESVISVIKHRKAWKHVN